MRFAVAQFVHRYPPAVGGAELYMRRLSEYLAGEGDRVTVWTTTAVELGEFWGARSNPSPQPPPRSGEGEPDTDPILSATSAVAPPRLGEGLGRGWLRIRRYPPLTFPLRRYLLKAASLVPYPPTQALTLPCNPICPGMWRDAGRYDGPLDAVHATAFPYSFPLMCARRLARRRRVPFLLTPFLHLGDPADPRDRIRRQYTRRPLRWLLRQADRVFAQTPGERQAIIDLGVPAERIILQGLGVEPAECTGGNRRTARAAWGVADSECVIGHLANNSVEKGTVDLLTAVAKRPVRVVLAGPEMPNFRRFRERHPSANVIRLGVLTDQQKRDFFAGIDVFCLPSRTDSFGLVLLEAWANGVPVVVYRAGGPGELVRDGIDGFVTACDPAALREPLWRLANDVELRRRMGEIGRVRTATEFCWADKLRLVREAIRSVL